MMKKSCFTTVEGFQEDDWINPCDCIQPFKKNAKKLCLQAKQNYGSKKFQSTDHFEKVKESGPELERLINMRHALQICASTSFNRRRPSEFAKAPPSPCLVCLQRPIPNPCWSGSKTVFHLFLMGTWLLLRTAAFCSRPPDSVTKAVFLARRPTSPDDGFPRPAFYKFTVRFNSENVFHRSVTSMTTWQVIMG